MDLILTGSIAGMLGTLMMDSLNHFFSRYGLISKIEVRIIGRMAFGWANGRFRYSHPDEIDPVPNEKVYGYLAHYAIKVGFAIPFWLGWDLLIGGPVSPMWTFVYA